ncbi:hypothetical protein [Phenylobacterium sp.]|uniref:hypothetical protein n=1 Tax=Phenylobacterium sp. TaxID=1871053 RepID=UPI0025E7E81C|nr:hypothetical protein [Phenylobacterium sp.]
MENFWLRALDEAERAEARAKALRARFGEAAEARCRDELQSFAESDPRRRRVADVFRALRWT